MKCPIRPDEEEARLAALAEYGIDEHEGLPSLQLIVDMAVRMFDCPAAAVNMIGDDHVFLAASEGVRDCDMSRDASFCAHAINQDGVMVVEDAAHDPRFHDNPLVKAGLIRFYAGVALKSPSGHALGALCVLDDMPHAAFPPEDRRRLTDLAALVTDKLELRRLETQAAARPSRFEASAATSPNAVICFGADARVTAWNAAATAMFGYSEAAMVGEPIDRIIDARDHPLVRAAIARVLDGGTPLTEATPLVGVRASGECFPGEIHWSHWQEDGAMHFGTIVRDMTDVRREHDALYRLANYDSLTGLPNRNLLRTRLAETIGAERRFAILVADLGGFADINNTLGQAAGDAVLIEIASRLETIGGGPDLVARIGGAAFALLAEGRNPLALDALAHQMLTMIGAPILVDGQEVRLAGNIGIATAPEHGTSDAELIGSAELALFQARQRGPGTIFHFIPNLRAEAVARRMYDAELHHAVEREEFRLFYQPQVRLADQALTGAEALIRWKHPTRGLLKPSAFLPALDAGVLAAPVGAWVLETACAQAANWRRLDPAFRMSVNLSSAQFRRGDLAEVVSAALRRHALAPDAIELEITENILLHDEEDVVAHLEALRALGVALSFDDFGTGYASLNLLREAPVTHIKIDKSFTFLMRSSERDRVIVTGLVEMARRLGIGVIAEGVEDADDAEFLRSYGCDEGQGYWFGEPVPATIFEELYLGERRVKAV